MTYSIGDILKGTIGDENATFEVVQVNKKDALGGEYTLVSCVELGAPLIRIEAHEIGSEVRA